MNGGGYIRSFDLSYCISGHPTNPASAKQKAELWHRRGRSCHHLYLYSYFAANCECVTCYGGRKLHVTCNVHFTIKCPCVTCYGGRTLHVTRNVYFTIKCPCVTCYGGRTLNVIRDVYFTIKCPSVTCYGWRTLHVTRNVVDYSKIVIFPIYDV